LPTAWRELPSRPPQKPVDASKPVEELGWVRAGVCQERTSGRRRAPDREATRFGDRDQAVAELGGNCENCGPVKARIVALPSSRKPPQELRMQARSEGA